jgi:hypothetical protein
MKKKEEKRSRRVASMVIGNKKNERKNEKSNEYEAYFDL